MSPMGTRVKLFSCLLLLVLCAQFHLSFAVENLSVSNYKSNITISKNITPSQGVHGRNKSCSSSHVVVSDVKQTLGLNKGFKRVHTITSARKGGGGKGKGMGSYGGANMVHRPRRGHGASRLKSPLWLILSAIGVNFGMVFGFQF